MPARIRTCVFGGILAIGAASQPGSVAADEGKEFYKGKTATWFVGTGPGGGHDFYARLLARHMPKYLPGVTIVVANRPGAGHIIAANIINASKPDGLAWGSFSTGLVYSQIMKTRGIRFDLAKMSWIGKAASDPRTIIVATKSEYKTFDDVLASKRPVKFSTSGIGAGSYIDSYLTARAFNINHKLIVGYSGGASALGLMRGETDVLQGGSESGLEIVGMGYARIVLQFGKLVPNIPDANDYAKTPLQKALCAMLEESGKLARLTAGPPDIPPDRLKTLRQAYMETVRDPEVMAQAKRAGREVEAAPGEEVHKSIMKILVQPPEILSMLTESSSATVEQAKIEMMKHTGPISKIERNGGTLYISHEGKEVSAKVSNSRTAITVAGNKAGRKDLKVGMTCTFEYPAPGQEAKSVACK